MKLLGGHANLDVDETVLRISISTMRHTGTLSGELLSCRMASSECENSGPANVELKNWESKAQAGHSRYRTESFPNLVVSFLMLYRVLLGIYR